MRFMVVFLVLLAASPAKAACTNPAGVEGQMVYNTTHKVLQYCDGDKWWGMGWKQAPGAADSDNTRTTSEYVKEFSGVIVGPSDWPACVAPAKIVTLGRIHGAPHHSSAFLDIRVYGSHAGYNNSNYFHYKNWVLVLSHQRISSNLTASSGSDNFVKLWNGSTAGDYNGQLITSDFDVRLQIEPACGSGREYTYVVRYDSRANFTPHTQRIW